MRCFAVGSVGVCSLGSLYPVDVPCEIIYIFLNSLCRAAILTGRYQTRSGVYPGVFSPPDIGG